MKKLTFIALLIPLLVSCGSASPNMSDRDYTRTHPAPNTPAPLGHRRPTLMPKPNNGIGRQPYSMPKVGAEPRKSCRTW